MGKNTQNIKECWDLPTQSKDKVPEGYVAEWKDRNIRSLKELGEYIVEALSRLEVKTGENKVPYIVLGNDTDEFGDAVSIVAGEGDAVDGLALPEPSSTVLESYKRRIQTLRTAMATWRKLGYLLNFVSLESSGDSPEVALGEWQMDVPDFVILEGWMPQGKSSKSARRRLKKKVPFLKYLEPVYANERRVVIVQPETLDLLSDGSDLPSELVNLSDSLENKQSFWLLKRVGNEYVGIKIHMRKDKGNGESGYLVQLNLLLYDEKLVEHLTNGFRSKNLAGRLLSPHLKNIGNYHIPLGWINLEQADSFIQELFSKLLAQTFLDYNGSILWDDKTFAFVFHEANASRENGILNKHPPTPRAVFQAQRNLGPCPECLSPDPVDWDLDEPNAAGGIGEATDTVERNGVLTGLQEASLGQHRLSAQQQRLDNWLREGKLPPKRWRIR